MANGQAPPQWLVDLRLSKQFVRTPTGHAAMTDSELASIVWAAVLTRLGGDDVREAVAEAVMWAMGGGGVLGAAEARADAAVAAVVKVLGPPHNAARLEGMEP